MLDFVCLLYIYFIILFVYINCKIGGWVSVDNLQITMYIKAHTKANNPLGWNLYYLLSYLHANVNNTTYYL